MIDPKTYILAKEVVSAYEHENASDKTVADDITATD